MTLAETTDLKIKDNLKSWFEYASDPNYMDGLKLYKESQTFCKDVAAKYNLDSYTVACVLSCFHPINKLELSKKNTISVIKKSQSSENYGTIKVAINTKKEVTTLSILSGSVELKDITQQMHSFAMSIGLSSNAHVSIDKWHVRACLCKPNETIDNVETVTLDQYQRIERITAELAHKLKYKAYEFQAIISATIKYNMGKN